MAARKTAHVAEVTAPHSTRIMTCAQRSRKSPISQIPSDLVVKSQVVDIIDLILQLIEHLNGVHRPCRNRKSRGAVLSTSEGQWATTKFDGVREVLLAGVSGHQQNESARLSGVLPIPAELSSADGV